MIIGRLQEATVSSHKWPSLRPKPILMRVTVFKVTPYNFHYGSRNTVWSSSCRLYPVENFYRPWIEKTPHKKKTNIGVELTHRKIRTQGASIEVIGHTAKIGIGVQQRIQVGIRVGMTHILNIPAHLTKPAKIQASGITPAEISDTRTILTNFRPAGKDRVRVPSLSPIHSGISLVKITIAVRRSGIRAGKLKKKMVNRQTLALLLDPRFVYFLLRFSEKIIGRFLDVLFL